MESMKGLVISIIVMIFLIEGFIIFYSSTIGNYGATSAGADSTLSVNSSISRINEKMEKLRNRTVDKTENTNFLFSISDGVLAFIDTGSVILEFPSMVGDTIDSVNEASGGAGIQIPRWFLDALTMILSVTAVFLVVSIFLRRDDI